MLRLWISIASIATITIGAVHGVINGRKACLGQFPYIVAVWKQNKAICSGGIINERHILTAAHCLGIMTELECSVTIGITDLRTASMRVRALQFYPHPEYKRIMILDKPLKYLVMHDIAIIKLAEEVKWSRLAQPISLRRQAGFSSCECYIGGWGATKYGGHGSGPKMRWTKLYVLNTQQCLMYVALRVNEGCLVDPNYVASAGPGDSGGPVNCNGLLVGIVTGGLSRMHAPTAFLRIYPYLSFIDEVLSYTPQPSPTPNVFEFLNQEGLLCL